MKLSYLPEITQLIHEYPGFNPSNLVPKFVLVTTLLCCPSLEVIYDLATVRFIFIQKIFHKYYLIDIIPGSGYEMVNKTRHCFIPGELNSLEGESC